MNKYLMLPFTLIGVIVILPIVFVLWLPFICGFLIMKVVSYYLENNVSKLEGVGVWLTIVGLFFVGTFSVFPWINLVVFPIFNLIIQLLEGM